VFRLITLLKALKKDI